ncbi:MAG: hypothetical protein ABJA02_06055 [Acidobacteriota bacterium]
MKALLLPFFLCMIVFAQVPRFQFTHKGSVLHIKFSPSGSKLLSYSSGSQDLALWEVSTGRLVWIRPISFIQKADEYYTLNAFSWSPDEKLVSTGSANGTVQLWDAGNGKIIWRADVANDGISAIAFSPDATTIAATGYDSTGPAATLINVVDGSIVKRLVGNKCRAIGITFDPSGKELSVGNLDGNIVRWNLAEAKPINTADCDRS